MPVYGARDPHYRDIPDRDQCWAKLGKPIQERLLSRAGKLLDWWALPNDKGRIRAVVLGADALVTAEPTLNDAGRPAHRIHPVQLDQGSFRFIEVTGTAQKLGRGGGGGKNSAGLGQPAEHLGLDAEMIDFLGNLPTRAQILLQSPFVNDVANLDYRYYFYRTGTSSAGNLFVGCYLADERVLTFASGTRHHPRGTPEWQGSWRLICRQAAVNQCGELP